MATRTEWLLLERELSDYHNIHFLIGNIKEFKRLIHLKRKKSKIFISAVLQAKRHMETSLIFLKSFINPKMNPYLTDYEEDVLRLVGDLGRWSKRLDDYEREIRTKADDAPPMRFKDRDYQYFRIKSLLENIQEAEQVLLYLPLLYVKNKIPELKKKGISIDAYLIAYLIFWSLLNTGEILGVVTREEGLGKKMVGQQVIIPKTIPPIPENVQYETGNSEEPGSLSSLEEMFQEEDSDEMESSQLV